MQDGSCIDSGEVPYARGHARLPVTGADAAPFSDLPVTQVRNPDGLEALADGKIILNGRALLGVQARTAATLEDEVGQTTRALADQAGRGVATAVSPGVVGYSVLSEPAVLPPARSHACCMRPMSSARCR
jgi:hypothetical protein